MRRPTSSFVWPNRKRDKLPILYQFTSLLNRHFSAEQKERIIEHLWRVAFADAKLSAWEQHLVRKVADLLYVPHSVYIAAKLRARDAAGLGSGTPDASSG